ncbi:MAG TPA: ABC transporter permease, partial [Pseudonocardiaceae bacterium]|nr:ABC transporter permease [Pseudonocardiaceae bacterium]
FGIIAAVQYKSISSGQHVEGEFGKSTALSLSLIGTNFAQLVLGVLGVLVTAGEYSTGMIRSTLTAVPRRLPVLWSKAAVFGGVALVVGTLGALITFLFVSGIVSGTPAALTLGDTGVLRSLLGAGLYLSLVGVIGTALGALLRSVAGGISVLVGALMLVPGLILLLPSAWRDSISPYLPSNAGEAMFALHHAANTLTPIAGFAVFLSWTVLALAGAAYRLVRTDA